MDVVLGLVVTSLEGTQGDKGTVMSNRFITLITLVDTNNTHYIIKENKYHN